jgi:hypothetical protein
MQLSASRSSARALGSGAALIDNACYSHVRLVSSVSRCTCIAIHDRGLSMRQR